MRRAVGHRAAPGLRREPVAGRDGQAWAFLKEISSDGNVSTIDVLYPASPVWVYADPGYLALLLAPLRAYAESGHRPELFAAHDLGSAYPVASGHNDGGGKNMPVEETGNTPAHRAGVHLREHDAEPGAVQRPVRHDQR